MSSYHTPSTITWSRQCLFLFRPQYQASHRNIRNFANPVALIEHHAVWSLLLQVAVGALSGSIVKVCFALRVWRCKFLYLSCRSLGAEDRHSQPAQYWHHRSPHASRHCRNECVTSRIICNLVSLPPVVFAGVYTAQGFTHSDLPLIVLTTSYTEKLWGTLALSAGAATDVLTALALCYYLHKLKTGYSQSDGLVKQLSIFAVNTGLLTSAASLSTLILYNFMPANFIFMSVYFVVSKRASFIFVLGAFF